MQVGEPWRRLVEIEDLIMRFEDACTQLSAVEDEQRHFCGMYQRSTISVREELVRGGFDDPIWVERWTVAFADLYLDALAARELDQPVSRPWQLALAAGSGVSPLGHQLVGLNAHLNFDLPRALLSVVADEEFDDDALLASRYADFEHIDSLVLRRVPEEYRYLRALGGPVRTQLLARLLYPLNLVASRRWLVAARRSVWGNALQLSMARRSGPDELAGRVADLEVLCAAKVAELLRPGQVVLRLAKIGFGVNLPPARRQWPTDHAGAHSTSPADVRGG
jgi:hypothetical protein